MAICTIKIVEGRSSLVRRGVIETVSRALADKLVVPVESVHVLIEDVPAGNWGHGGRGVSDNQVASIASDPAVAAATAKLLSN